MIKTMTVSVYILAATIFLSAHWEDTTVTAEPHVPRFTDVASIPILNLIDELKPDSEPVVVPEVQKIPPPEPPQIKIKAPYTVEEHSWAHIEVLCSGGPIREYEITWDPDIDPEKNLSPSIDWKQIYLTGEPKVYSLTVFVTGKDVGWSKATARIAITRKGPPPPTTPPSDDIEDRMWQWVVEVPTKNREAELIEVIKAGHQVADEIRNKRLDSSQAGEAWATQAYRNLTSVSGAEAFKAWNINPTGISFFAHISETCAEYARDVKGDMAVFIDNLCVMLEKKK